jgi:hypothetical protein
MASTFKRLNSEDITVTKTPLYESIPITGSLVSSSVYLQSNIKSYSHGMFQSVYDYPYLSSSANQLFDITLGRSSATTGTVTQTEKKKNIYNQMAQILVGYDQTGSIKFFDNKNTTVFERDTRLHDAYFLSFSRLLVKDEIKKGSFQMVVGVANNFNNPMGTKITITDAAAATNYFIDSPTGEYGILKASSSPSSNPNTNVGLIFYQAGVVVLSPHIFSVSGTVDTITNTSTNQEGQLTTTAPMSVTDGTSAVSGTMAVVLVSASIDGCADGLRRRIDNIQFNNTTELNSTIYFCRANSSEFNYSSNPTYLSSSKIVVKNTRSDAPISYITTVGMYSIDNELLAVAKLSEPLKKTPDDSLILRVRLDV